MMPTRLFDVQKHPRRAAYTLMFFCLILIATLIYSISKGQEVARLQGELRSDKENRVVACEAIRPKQTRLIESFIYILQEQKKSAQALLRATHRNSHLSLIRQHQIRDFTIGIELLEATQHSACESNNPRVP